MDRLVKPEVKEVNVVFSRGQKCSATFKLTNLMHTMSVAVSLTTTTTPSLFSFTQPLSIIPPLSTSSFTLFLLQPSDLPPLSTPPENVLVRTSMLPTGKASQEELRRLFSKHGKHIFKDASIPISFVGPQVVEFLLFSSSKSLEIAFILSQAIAFCDKPQLTSLLRSAAVNGNAYFVSTLIDAGADVNNLGSDGESVMSLAVQTGNIHVVQILIESGYTIDHSVDRLLHDAAAMGRIDLMEILCLGYLDLDVNLVDSYGQTALHIAAVQGDLQVLQFLVTLGADPDVANTNGWTALHCASCEGHLEAVEFLLNCSMYVKYALTKEGKTAFGLAEEKGHLKLYDMLQLGDDLHRAAAKDDVNVMRNCIAEGADVNGKDQNGWTPLHRAAFKGRTESVKLLLNHGAQVDVVDDSGYTPLHMATEMGHAKVAMQLIAHGAKANLKSLTVVPFDLDSSKKHSSFVNRLGQARKSFTKTLSCV